MIKCSECCTPCCDFCIYAEHEILEDDTEPSGYVKGGPIHCKLHNDEEHDMICECCGSCNDFHCFRVK